MSVAQYQANMHDGHKLFSLAG